MYLSLKVGIFFLNLPVALHAIKKSKENADGWIIFRELKETIVTTEDFNNFFFF